MTERPELSTDEEAPSPEPSPEAYDAAPRPGPMARMRRRSVLVSAILVAAMVAGVGGGLAGGLVDGLFLPPLAPDAALVKVQEDRDAAALDDLRARYPRDPRVLFLSSFGAKDRAEAEKLLRAAVDERRVLRRKFPDGKLEANMRCLLARLLQERGAEAEAADALRPSCGADLEAIAERAGLTPGWANEVCAAAPKGRI